VKTENKEKALMATILDFFTQICSIQYFQHDHTLPLSLFPAMKDLVGSAVRPAEEYGKGVD
jgi:hypothetical protein